MRRDGNGWADRSRAIVWWGVLPALCLALYWGCVTAWFRADDFAWLNLARSTTRLSDLPHALFAPQAQGTIRPWSERAFFIVLYKLFGLNPLPFRIVVFATQFLNLGLAGTVGMRLTGKPMAGVLAAFFWLVNSALVEPLGWTCVYNEVLCGFFLLLAFYFLLRHIETGRRRYYAAQWGAFLLGLGALELTVMYPVIAAVYCFLCARKHFRGALPLFVPAVGYSILHGFLAAVPKSGPYAPHVDGSMLRSFSTLWAWSVSALFLDNSIVLPSWVLPAGAGVVSAALVAFVIRRVQRGRGAALFCVAWFGVMVAPVLPLRDHLSGYYVYLPLIGLCWLGAWAFSEGWSSGSWRRGIAVAVAALYLFMTAPRTWATAGWIHDVSARTEELVKGVRHAHELQPEKAILLYGVDTQLFLNGIKDRPFLLVGADRVFLAPGSERSIDAAGVEEFLLPADVTAQALGRDQLVVYDARGPRLTEMTQVYKTMPRQAAAPSRVDVANPLMGYLVGPEWHQNEGNHRWMPKRASLRLGAPKAAGKQLTMAGFCPEELLRGGPVHVTVTIDGAQAGTADIRETTFRLSFPIPAAAVGQAEMQVAIEIDRALHPAGDVRELGLVFGVFEVR